MASDQVFTKNDTALYPSWQPEGDGLVILYIPGIGQIRMTLAKAEEISADLARQAEYGRWYAIEKKHLESQKKLPI